MTLCFAQGHFMIIASLAACGAVDFAGQNLGAWPEAIVRAHHRFLAGWPAFAGLRHRGTIRV